MSSYLVYFKGRNTGVAVAAGDRSQAIKKAKETGAAGSKGEVVKARTMTPSEERTAKAGNWVRTRPDGSNPTGNAESRAAASKYKSAYRSGPAKQSKA